MTKILYIHDKSFQALNNIRAMKEGFDIVDYSGDELIDTGEFTHVIQHLHPNWWARYGTMEHIGWLDYITDDSLEKLCMVDQIWAPSAEILSSLNEKVYQGDIYHVEHIFDPAIYEKKYDFQEIPEIRGTFPFFVSSIGHNDRMSIERIIQSFWEEFDPTEPVSLILNCGPETDKIVEFVKNRIKLYDNTVYQKVILIDHKLSNEQELGIVQNIIGCNINITNNWSVFDDHCYGFDLASITLYASDDIKFIMRDVYMHSHLYKSIVPKIKTTLDKIKEVLDERSHPVLGV